MILPTSSAAEGSSSIEPTPWPVGRMPTSVRPSTMVARVSIGALAASATCPPGQVLGPFHPEALGEECPQRGAGEPSEAQGVGGCTGEAGEPGSLESADHVGGDNPLRSAVDGRGDHGAGDRGGEVPGLDDIRNGALGREQEAGAHGDAIGTPGQCSGEAPSVDEPAGGDDRQVDGVEHLGDEQRGRDDAGVATALGALGDDGVDTPFGDLLGVAACPDGGNDHDAGLLEPGDGGLARGLGERCHLHLGGDEVLDPAFDVVGVGAHVHAEGGVGAAPHLVDVGHHLIEGQGGGGEDAEAAGVGRGNGEPGSGHPSHTGLHDRIPHPDQVAEPRV